MKTDDAWKKYLLEADVEEKDFTLASKIIAHMQASPEIFGEQNPPVGYEDQLLQALRRKLPEVKPRAKARPERSWLSGLWTGWGLGFGLAVSGFLVFMIFNQTVSPSGSEVAQEKTYLELVGADQESAQNWLATVSDSGFRIENGNQDLQGMAIQISKDENLLKKMNNAIAQWEH